MLSFLSIISVPEGASVDRVAEAMLAPLGEARAPGGDAPDLHTFRLRLRMEPPVVIGLFEAGAVGRACEAVRRLGGSAFAATVAELSALGATRKTRDLRLEHGELVFDLWDGSTDRVPLADVFALVRAHLAGEIVRRDISAVHIPGGPRTLSLMPHETRAEFARSSISRKQLETSDKLDIHTTDGRVFQLDGDKFGYGLLGEMRQYSDKVNMDRMFDLLQHVAEHAVADNYFSLFKPPASIKALRLPRPLTGSEDLRFAFYSRLVVLMYRHLLGTP